MSFSEKMRESLGAEGVRVEVRMPSEPLVAGQPHRGTVELQGGARPAHIERLLVRLVEAVRFWRDETGASLPEEEARTREERRNLTAAWSRTTLQTFTFEVGRELDAGAHLSIPIEIVVPGDCKPSSICCSHTLSVHAAIRGQIDPSTLARIVVASDGEPI